MSSDFCKLSDIAYVQGGFAFKSADFSDSGVAVVKIANIQPPSVSLSGVDRIPHEKLKGLERFELHDGDVLMAMTGATVGKVGRFRRTEPAYLNQRVARISAIKGRQFDDFVYAVVSLPGFDGLIEGASAGSAQANISASGIGSVAIWRLSDDEQIRIGIVARALDDRITLLRETNATLEAIAQAIFKSWFVDFDPVRAKQEGRAPEGMDEATAALFPDSFEESELGLVPRGWRVGTFADLLRLHKGTVNPLTQPDVLFEHYSLPAFDDGQMPISEAGAEIKSNKTPVPANAVLISKLNPHIPRVWMPTDAGQHAVCSTEFLVFVPAGGASKYFNYCSFSAPQFLQSLCQLVTGTSNSHQRVKPDGILSMPTIVATGDVLSSFGALAGPMFDRIGHNRKQTQTLATLRDTLLPRLISGQLRLPDAQDAIAEAAA